MACTPSTPIRLRETAITRRALPAASVALRQSRASDGRNVFLTTLVAFFLVEIGDKTQIVTMLLAARFQNIVLVAAGTTTGMLIADVPAVFFGERAARLLPLPVMRRIAAALFGALGLWILLGALLK